MRLEFVAWGRIDPSEFGGWGDSVASVGDLDGDGVRDLIVGNTGPMFGVGSVYACSSRTGKCLWRMPCPIRPKHRGCSFGSRLCPLGDVDGDGIDDFSVGDPSLHPWDGQMPPYGAWIVSAARGDIVHAFVNGSIEGFGGELSCPGDIDRDGVDDLLVGSTFDSQHVLDAYSGRPGERLLRVQAGARGHDARVEVARDPASIRSFTADWGEESIVIFDDLGLRFERAPMTAADITGRRFRALEIGDADGDGVVDFYERGQVAGRGLARIISGADGSDLAVWQSSLRVPLGDLDGDGRLEFAKFGSDFGACEVLTLRRVTTSRATAR